MRKEVNNMPRGDRTGPIGSGPMTGRGMGYCAGFAGPGFMYPGPGYGYGRGFGFGRGFGRGFGYGRGRGWRFGGHGRFWGYPYPQIAPYWTSPPLSEEQEMDFLEEQEKILEDELKQLKKRQAVLKKRNQETK
jgi:hypothetical protein